MEGGASVIFSTIAKLAVLGIGVACIVWGWRGWPSTTGGEDAAPEPQAAEPKPAPAAKAAPKPPKPAAAKPAPKPEPAPKPATKPDAAPDPAPAPANLHATRPDTVDDLKRIKGVGPKMEAVLNDKGVYQFSQIAAFTDADLRWLDAATGSFPGRAERDDWVGQARTLAGS